MADGLGDGAADRHRGAGSISSSDNRPERRSNHSSEPRSCANRTDQEQAGGIRTTHPTGARRTDLRHSSDTSTSADRDARRLGFEGILRKGVPIPVSNPDDAGPRHTQHATKARRKGRHARRGHSGSTSMAGGKSRHARGGHAGCIPVASGERYRAERRHPRRAAKASGGGRHAHRRHTSRIAEARSIGRYADPRRCDRITVAGSKSHHARRRHSERITKASGSGPHAGRGHPDRVAVTSGISRDAGYRRSDSVPRAKSASHTSSFSKDYGGPFSARGPTRRGETGGPSGARRPSRTNSVRVTFDLPRFTGTGDGTVAKKNTSASGEPLSGDSDPKRSSGCRRTTDASSLT